MTKIAKAQGRSVEEWRGATPDAMPPASVRLRILRRHNHKCSLTGIIIADGQTFDLDHKVRIEDGGENIESNLQPVLRLPHEVKSAAERKSAAKADRIAKRAHGLDAPKQKIRSAGFPARPERPNKIEKRTLPPRPMFEDVRGHEQ
jgi:5-methylcytosine-specific restriction protein A